MKKKIVLGIGCVCMLVSLWMPVSVKAEEEILIHNFEELSAIRENPEGKYRLVNDIDAAGIDWVPLDFSGELDGDGHAILNVFVSETSNQVETTYDGNMKTYDTVFAGFFGTLTDAKVKNINLVNLRCEIEENRPVFLGGIAGFMERSQIENCKISGMLSLLVDAKMFGVGGIVGFGNGSIDDSMADMTLVCVDTNKEERDEQFMGGGYAAGYISLGNCNIMVHGFDSDHGYVHNGGLVGMFGLYPAGTNADTYIKNSHVEGKITFFEDNTDRRAYCAPYCGEVLNWTYAWGGCSENFISDERFDYSKNLLPEMCEEPQLRELKTESTDTEFGYTTYSCASCGYSYTDNYVLKLSDLKRIKEEQEAIEVSKQAEEASIRAEEESKAAYEESLKATTQAEVGVLDEIDKKNPAAYIVLVVAILAAGVIVLKTKK